MFIIGEYFTEDSFGNNSMSQVQSFRVLEN